MKKIMPLSCSCFLAALLVLVLAGSGKAQFGPELVNNGGFECPAGNTCWVACGNPCSDDPNCMTVADIPTSITGSIAAGWTKVNCGTGAGVYNITNDGWYTWQDHYTSSTDHHGGTPHSGTYFALFDGAPGTCGVAGCQVPIWSQTINSLTIGKWYFFTAWVMQPKWDNSAWDPKLVLKVGGSTIYTTIPLDTQYLDPAINHYSALTNPTKWIQVGAAWQATSTSTTIAIDGIMATTGLQADDFGIDDISFREVTATLAPLYPNCGNTTKSGTLSSPGVCSVTIGGLPVELLSFTAQNSASNEMLLQWTTASEKNTSYFSVEKSPDEKNFFEIGRESAAGPSSNLLGYQYTDVHFMQSSYYRLKMVDNDGSFKFSNVLFVGKNENQASILHAGSGEIEVKAFAEEAGEWHIAVYDVLGRQFVNEDIHVKKGENIFTKKVSFEEAGARIFRITDASGAVVLQEMRVW